MTKLAITGHRGLPEHTTRLVDAGLRAEIGKYADNELTGISCIADGADALFAQAVLEAGGSLLVIVPAKQYQTMGTASRCGVARRGSTRVNIFDDLLTTAVP